MNAGDDEALNERVTREGLGIEYGPESVGNQNTRAVGPAKLISDASGYAKGRDPTGDLTRDHNQKPPRNPNLRQSWKEAPAI